MPSKNFSSEILSSSCEDLRDSCCAPLLWDGSMPKSATYSYYTVGTHFAAGVQIPFLLTARGGGKNESAKPNENNSGEYFGLTESGERNRRIDYSTSRAPLRKNHK